MNIVYLLYHIHVLPDGEEDSKLIGVYRSNESAEAAVAHLRSQPGFRDFPKLLGREDDASGFYIDPYELDKARWTEGFVTV